MKAASSLYACWSRDDVNRTYGLLLPESAIRTMWHGDKKKILRAMTAWRKHIGETMKLPSRLSLKMVAPLRRSDAERFIVLAHSPVGLRDKMQQKGFLDGRLIVFQYGIGNKAYYLGCMKSGGRWRPLNVPFDIDSALFSLRQ